MGTLRLINGTGDRPTPLSPARIGAMLKELEVHFAVDDEGDHFADWDDYRMWFMASGEAHDVLRISCQWDVRPPARMLPAFAPIMNRWNASKRHPVVYAGLMDENQLYVAGDLNILLTDGCTDAFLKTQIRVMGLACQELIKHLSAEFPEHAMWDRVNSES